jgi:hypothetical protein
MSWLSNLTGVGISKKGVKINPKKALLTGLTLATGGGLLGAAKGVGMAMKGGAGLGTALKAAGGVAGGDAVGRFKSIGGFLKNNARTIADVGQVGEGIYDKYQENRQYQDARRDWEAAAPLRDAGMAGLLDTSRPDVSHLFRDEGNPQGRYRRVNVGSTGGY